MRMRGVSRAGIRRGAVASLLEHLYLHVCSGLRPSGTGSRISVCHRKQNLEVGAIRREPGHFPVGSGSKLPSDLITMAG